ncbi:MAG: SGNH/GDSL hydrolase family protein [Deltaproteobacteria bacterium]|nr:SGNH/GDSL hydrolase family protein [Deltaproteobacteria bacterium]
MTWPKTPAKRIFFWFLAFAPLLIVIEASSYILIKKTIPSRIIARLGKTNLDSYLIQRKEMPSARPKILSSSVGIREQKAITAGLKMFHPVLGWNYPPNIVYQNIDGITYHHGPHGERITCSSYYETPIATYGDSFTYCENVRDECTWQTFLARKLNQNVLNFGVGGYGTDQAVLKYELQNQIKTKIVMLCILPENINRVVNIYRPFYTYNDPLRLTKPIFIKKNNQLKLVPNPLKRLADIKKLDEKTFLEDLAKYDYWYQLDQKLPELSFPWTASLLRWRKPVFQQIYISLPWSLRAQSSLHYPWNLFDEDYPFSVMQHVVDLFVANAHKRGATPLIVIMPHKDFIQESMDYGFSRVARLTDYLSKAKYPFIDVVQIMADMNLSRSKLGKLYHDHATTEGNQVLADILYSYLKTNFKQLLNF